MYVCLCNALTDKRMKQAVVDSNCVAPRDVYAACGCRVQCGRCVQAVLQLLRDGPTGVADPQMQGAD